MFPLRNQTRVSMFAIAGFSLLLAGQIGAVTIPADRAIGPPGSGTGVGLDASFYDANVRITSNARADDFRNANVPTATFVATLANYPVVGNVSSSGTALVTFLGNDGDTLSGAFNNNLRDSVFYFEGFISITSDMDVIGNNSTIDLAFAVGSDDGMRLRIGSVVVTEFTSPRSFGFSGDIASFEEEGLYPIDLLYRERGGSTGVEFHSTIPGGPNAGAPPPTQGIVPASVLSRSPGGPQCDAGGPYVAECAGETTVIELSGKGTDPDGDPLTFQWETDCPDAMFDDATSSTALLEVGSFAAPVECVVKLSVADSSGNETTCEAKLSIKDSTPPLVTCPPAFSMEAAGDCGAQLSGVAADVTVNDACAPVESLVFSQEPAAGTFLDLGAHIIQIEATDPAGNTGECDVTVTVIDSTPPTLTCPAPFITEPNEGCTYVGSISEAGATDDCSSDRSITISSDAPGAFPAGTTLVTWTATDEAGNSSECTSVVTITDDVPPVLSCPVPLVVETTQGCSYDGAIEPATATDDCSAGGTLTIDSDAPGSFPVGTTQITWTATDASGNSSSCVASVRVVDLVPPELACDGDLVIAADGTCGLSGAIPPPTSSDNCTAPTDIVVTNDAPTPLPLGTTEVTWTAVDAAGNSASCVSRITIVDATPPSLTCPGDLTLDPNADCSYVGTIGSASANDACTSQENIVVTNDAPGTFPLGTTVVTWTAVDEAGNDSSCTQLVVVRDTTPPELVCIPSLTFEANASCGYVGTFGTPFVEDNCESGDTLFLENDAPGVFPVGTTDVLWSVTDRAGNTASCVSSVVVSDTTPPTVICPPFATVGCGGEDGATVDFPVIVNDACDADLEATCSVAPGSLFPVGTTLVTCTAVDGSGNQGVCEIEVRVVCGGIQPGDCNQDGLVGISDAICLLNVLFGGGGLSAADLPCAGGPAAPANQSLMSWNANPTLELTDAIGLLNWRFLGGLPHPLGSDCRQIEGCPEACSLAP